MKLKIVPARTGVLWVKLGIRTFFRQPLALSGLFLMFMVITWLAGSVPVVGPALVLALLPACTLGFMAACKEADTGKFPMPAVFFSAFRAGRQQVRAMLVLGVLYGLGLWMITGVTALFDNGAFVARHMAGQMPTVEMVQDPATKTAILVFLALQLPLSLMFWHAPALVHWHHVPPLKSMFFSLVACLRNFWAYTLFGLAWMGVALGSLLFLVLLASLAGSPQLLGVVLPPVLMLIASMVLSSTYFTYRDCFDTSTGETA